MYTPTISLCLIAKDSSETLEACLASVSHLVDEIVLVDTGSTDRTNEIAARFGCRIFNFTWVDDFSAARNYAFDQATCEFVFWLDTDDVLLPDDRDRFMALKRQVDSDVDAVSMLYHYAFDEYGQPSLSMRRHRLVRRSRGFRWYGAVHEYLEVSGNILHSDVVVTHRRLRWASGRNLRIFERRREQGLEFTPRDLYYFGNELFDHEKYRRAAAVYKEFLATGQGWVEDVIAAYGKLADCYFYLGKLEEAIQSALTSFLHDTPRAEQCCRLGYYFLQNNRLQDAIYWYEAATTAVKPDKLVAITNEDCWTWLPHIQLCVCYDRIGDYSKAYSHNEQARKYRPQDANVLKNKVYLEQLKPAAQW